MKPPQKKEQPIIIEPLHIPRRSYRPDRMTSEQREFMRAAGEAILAAYKVLEDAMVAALQAESEHCGNMSYSSWMQFGCVYRQAQLFVRDICKDVPFPPIPSIKTLPETTKETT
ncbi:MAG: hypothetical protein V4719_10220 [Planctomycetota bacterium]